jgi:hypothetical protein
MRERRSVRAICRISRGARSPGGKAHQTIANARRDGSACGHKARVCRSALRKGFDLRLSIGEALRHASSGQSVATATGASKNSAADHRR